MEFGFRIEDWGFRLGIEIGVWGLRWKSAIEIGIGIYGCRFIFVICLISAVIFGILIWIINIGSRSNRKDGNESIKNVASFGQIFV